MPWSSVKSPNLGIEGQSKVTLSKGLASIWWRATVQAITNRSMSLAGHQWPISVTGSIKGLLNVKWPFTSLLCAGGSLSAAVGLSVSVACSGDRYPARLLACLWHAADSPLVCLLLLDVEWLMVIGWGFFGAIFTSCVWVYLGTAPCQFYVWMDVLAWQYMFYVWLMFHVCFLGVVSWHVLCMNEVVGVVAWFLLLIGALWPYVCVLMTVTQHERAVRKNSCSGSTLKMHGF